LEEDRQRKKRNEEIFSTNNAKKRKKAKRTEKTLQLFFKIKSALIKRTSINHDAPHERREEE